MGAVGTAMTSGQIGSLGRAVSKGAIGAGQGNTASTGVSGAGLASSALRATGNGGSSQIGGAKPGGSPVASSVGKVAPVSPPNPKS